MKKLIIKLTCIIIISALIFSIVLTTSAYSSRTYHHLTYNNNVHLVQNKTQSYMLSSNNNILNIEGVYPDSFSIKLTLNNKVHDYNLFTDTVVAICPDSALDQTEIVIYNIVQDKISSFNLAGTYLQNIDKTAYANGYVYVIDENNDVAKFSTSGKYITTYSLDNTVSSLLCSHDGTLYALSNYAFYIMSNNEFVCISYNRIFDNGSFISGDFFVDGNGDFYRLNNNSLTKPTDIRTDIDIPSGGMIGNYVIASINNTIYAVDQTNGNIKKSYVFNNNIVQLCAINNTVITLSYQNNVPVVHFINFSEFDDIKTNADNAPHDNLQSDSTKKSISSNVYTVDSVNYKILDIPSSTTVAQFKKNMNFSGYNVDFTRFDGKILKSGNVGTATVARFYNDHESYEYELSVIGDITGEGNMNSRDQKIFLKYLLHLVTFEGVYHDSANLDKKDPSVNAADLLVMVKLVCARDHKR